MSQTTNAMVQKHDKLASRLTYIIIELNKGARLSVTELAQELNVSERTIQKDLNQRIVDYLPVVKKNGRYYLEDFIIGKLSYDDIKNFAVLSGIQKLYPTLEDTFLSDVLNKKINNSCLIRGGSYEDITAKQCEFDLLRLAITLKHTIGFVYKEKRREVNPYKLLNNNDSWYLVGDENNQLKTFSFTKIEQLQSKEREFLPNREFLELINKNEQQWFSEQKMHVTLHIDSYAMPYFLRKKLLTNQTILQKTPSKLILKTVVSYEEEILQVVKYWIPHITIQEPQELHEKLLNQLQLYIQS